jgi:hypothetical protein
VIALDVLSVILLVLLLRRAFAPSRWLLIPLGVGLFAPMWATTGVWYASALQIVPMTAALYATSLFLVVYWQTAHRRWAIAALGAYMIGLAFWEKSLLITVVVAFLAVGFFSDGHLGQRLRGSWRILSAFALVSVAYVAAYVFALAGEEPLDDRPSLSDVGSVAYTAVVEVLIPTLFGGTWNAPSGGPVGVPSPAPWWVGILLLEVALAVVAVTILRNRGRALWAWAMLVVYVALDVFLLAWARFDFFGPLLARDPRYVEDAAPVFTLALALALVQVRRGASAPSAPSSAPGLDVPPAALRSPAAMLAMGAVIINSCLLTTVFIGDMWRQSAGRSFWTTFQADAEALGPISIVDRHVPEDVMAGLFLDKQAASYISQALPVDVAWDAPTESLYVLTDQGAIEPAALPSPVRSLVGPDGPCGYGVKESPRSIPLQSRLFEWDWVVRMSYLASADTTVEVSLGGKPVTVPLRKGPGQVWFVVTGAGSRVQVGIPTDEQGVCVAGVEVGVAEPAPPGQGPDGSPSS